MDLLDVMMKDVATEIPMTLIVVILSEEAQRIIVIGTGGETKCQQVCLSVGGWDVEWLTCIAHCWVHEMM